MKKETKQDIVYVIVILIIIRILNVLVKSLG